MDYSGGDNKAGNFNQAPERADDFIIEQGEHNPSALGKGAMAAGEAPGDYSETSDSTAENKGTMPLFMPPGSEINENSNDENQVNNSKAGDTTPMSDAGAVRQAIKIGEKLDNDSESFYEDAIGLRNPGEEQKGEE